MRGRGRALARALVALVVVVPVVAALLPASSASAGATYALRESSSPTRGAARALQGATLTGGAYVFVGPTTHVRSVAFYVDDTHRTKAPRRIDTSAPFDLVGGTSTAARPLWTSALREGTHHLTALVTTTRGRHLVLQSVFLVRNRPKPPTAVTATAGAGRVTLTWRSAGGTTAGFEIYRGPSSPVARSHPLDTQVLGSRVRSYVDTTALPGRTYRYVVVAVSAHGLRSASSATVTGGALSTAAPPVPSDVRATPGSGLITVSWGSGGGSTQGFDVYRSTSSDVELSRALNATRLPATARSFLDIDVAPGRTYYYVVAAVGADGARSAPSGVASASLLSEAVQLSTDTPVLYTARYTTATSSVIVTDTGDAQLHVSAVSVTGGSAFTVSPAGAFVLDPGGSRTVTVSFLPTANGPQRATLHVLSDDPDTPDATLGLGGLAINDPVGGEPSLQWIMDAYGLSAVDGDPSPSTYPLDASAIPPSNGVLVTGFTVHDDSAPVTVTALGAFVDPSTAGDPTKDPAWGWEAAGDAPGAATASYTVRRAFIGTTYSLAPGGPFSLWTRVEGITLRTDRDSAADPDYIAFPVAGSPNTYVLADDTVGGPTDDWNDLPLLLTNVDLVAVD
ncbi:MAG TPA: hypothetical protein VMI11_03375 [Actinomycetes bacterium]|nr:hypothetical protein [Actinomycetes bacterium]